MSRQKGDFRFPDFRNGSVELRFDGGEVCIYASNEGLTRIIQLCNELLAKRGNDHIHLGDHQILTGASLPGTLAVFRAVHE